MIPQGVNPTFDATMVPPDQGTPTHPAGLFDAQITGTRDVPTKDGTGGMLVVEFTTPAGKIDFRYNLWNQSPQAVEIANKQLSALCHATGIFRLNYNNPNGCAAELRGGRCKIEVAPQIDKQTGQPNGYTQIKRVFDAAGNEPGKAPAQQPNNAFVQQPQQQPGGFVQGNPQQPNPGFAGPVGQQQQPNAAWSNGPTQAQSQANPAPNPNNAAWNTQQPQPQQQPQPSGWQQQPGGAAPGPNGAPPWGGGNR